VYHSRTYQKSTSKALFGTRRQTHQDTLHNQVHQKNQEPVLGFLLILTKNTCGWVEVRLQEPAGSEAYWQAFRITGEDLGLDITQGDVEVHLQSTTLHSYRESVASSHSSRASTPSIPSVIRPRPSPYQPGSRDQEIAHSLAESLNINEPMSNTLTMEVPAGTINPTMGHVDADDAALFRAIGPDQPDPPSISGTDRTTHIPFGWIRPQVSRFGLNCSIFRSLLAPLTDYHWDCYRSSIPYLPTHPARLSLCHLMLLIMSCDVL
jgi:hypothetical protein